MRYTNVTPLIEAIKEIELGDLVTALKAHGGSIVFDESETSEILPPVEFYDDFKGPRAGDVMEARVVKNTTTSTEEKETVVLTINDEDKDTYDIDAMDLYPGMMSGITARIPELEKP